jgi:OOP family OmpA-OmpF porin
MKKSLLFQFLFSAFILSGISASAQNLVTNGSFEQDCPYNNNTSDFGFCHWFVPPNDYGTPDHYENNSSSNCFPCSCHAGENAWPGNVYALDGTNFTGFVGYYIQGNQINGREYIHEQLAQPLQAGVTYNIGFGVRVGPRSAYFINHFGMFISDTAIGATNQPPLYHLINVVPQLDINGTLSDTSWTIFSTSYTAYGGEQYVTIGNFTADSLLTITPNPNYSISDNSCLLLRYASYFFVDSVFILPPPMSVNDLKSNAQFSVFPNPSHDFVTVHSTSNSSVNYFIREISGRLISSGTLSPGSRETTISISDLASGIYFIELSDDQSSSTIKIVRE